MGYHRFRTYEWVRALRARTEGLDALLALEQNLLAFSHEEPEGFFFTDEADAFLANAEAILRSASE